MIRMIMFVWTSCVLFAGQSAVQAQEPRVWRHRPYTRLSGASLRAAAAAAASELPPAALVHEVKRGRRAVRSTATGAGARVAWQAACFVGEDRRAL